MAFLSTLTAAQQVAAIYIGYYDRAADPTGENFWEGAVANPNLSLADIATDFSTQSETQAVHPFFANPTAEEANAFITSLYLNLFNREPDADGLTFWSGVLQAAIDGTGTMSVGQIIIEIIEGAQNVPGGTQDLTTITNKIEVATTWTDAADAAGIDYNTDTGAQTSAKSIIEGVTDSQDTVASAKSTIDGFFTPAPVPGEEILLTSGTDVETGTADDDAFNAYIQQNPFAGGVSNSLSSADRLDGAGGNDRLYAEVTGEFVGVVGNVSTIDIQPRLSNIEEIDIEARESTFLTAENFLLGGPVVIDGKNITDHEELSSYYSDGDLKFENVTTLTSEGVARDTSSVTIGMDHTDNFNSDGDASDLTVLFDNDYLLARGETSVGQVFYFLLDEAAELDGNPNRLNNIDVDGLRFNITNADGTVTEVLLQSDAANVAGTHQGFVNALQAPLQALIADGTLPAGTTLVLDPTITDTTFVDDGSESDTIPAMVLTSGDGSKIDATGFTRIEEPIGEYDVYGSFNSEFETDPEPIHVNIDLYKAGRGGEGGDLIIGGKSENTPDGILDGIEVFKINVKGAGNDDPNGLLTKPSNLGTITSTGNELREVYIATDPMDAVGDTFASLTIRNGFDQFTFSDGESGDLELINADAFLGDLTLGDLNAANNPGRIANADTITAQGGGDVTLALDYNGSETAQAYSVTTAGGNDIVDILIDGDAVDYAGSSLNVMTAGGDDEVYIDGTDINIGDFDTTNERLNQTILDNITIETGDGDDFIVTAIDSKGDVNINAGSGDDVINTSGGRGSTANSAAQWTFNYDDAREATAETADVPGVPLSLAYLGGATVTVILSGAGISDPGMLGGGGGIMKTEAVNPTGVPGAVNGINGFEASATIGTLINGNRFYGDQRDVNAAVVAAVTNDPVLSELITLTLTENNTWVATMNSGGTFAEVDLRVEISQKNQTSWSAVEDEAQSVFSNSGIAVTSVASANAPTGFNLQTTYGADGIDDGPVSNDGSHLEGTDGWYTGLSARGDNNNAAEFSNGGSTDGARSLLETDNVINPGTGDDLVILSTDDAALRNTPNYTPLPGTSPETARNGNTLQNGASNETIIFESQDFGDDTIMNFTTAVTMSEQQAEDQTIVTAVGTDGTPANSDAPIPESFVLDVTAVPPTATGYDVNFDGVTTVVPINTTPVALGGLIAANYATASAGGWTAVDNGNGTVTFTNLVNPGDLTPNVSVANDFDSSTPAFEDTATLVVTDGAASGGTNPAVPSSVVLTFADENIETLTDGGITILGQAYNVPDGATASDIADLVAATPPAGYTVVSNSGGVLTLEGPATPLPTIITDGVISGTFTVDNVAFGLDFLDYSDYLTSQFDSSSGAGDSADSNILIPVTLDYNEGNTLGGSGANFSGDGATNVAVEANEVAIVRMANDTTDGETFASLTAADVANLFNNGAGYTGFGGDANFGDLNAGNFNVQTYQKTNQEALIGDGKAIFKVENPNNLGEYKVFELTWSGEDTASGRTVSAVEIGSQDFGTSLTGLDDVNLVGSQDYADLIQNGFYDPLVVAP